MNIETIINQINSKINMKKSSNETLELYKKELTKTDDSEIKERIGDVLNDVNLSKYDGISFECTSILSFADLEKEIKLVCKDLKLSPAFERNKEDKTKFLVQFPDLECTYSEEQINEIYLHNFKRLLDMKYANEKNKKVDKGYLFENAEFFTKESIMMFYRSFVNPYKIKPEDLYNDEKYRNKISSLFIEFLKDYNYKGESK